jgi:hypothetical protein
MFASIATSDEAAGGSASSASGVKVVASVCVSFRAKFLGFKGMFAASRNVFEGWLSRHPVHENHKVNARMNIYSRRNCLPRTREARGLLAIVGPLGVAALVICAPAHAESPGAATGDRCARLGADFVAISGAQRCVRVGGHVRAEAPRTDVPRVAAPRQALPGPNGYAAAVPDGLRPISEIFHIPAGSASGGSGLYRR